MGWHRFSVPYVMGLVCSALLGDGEHGVRSSNRPGGIRVEIGVSQGTAHTWTRVFSVRKASPEYVILKMPLNRSSARSPISRISSSGGTEPRLNSVTRMSSTIIGGFGDLFKAVVSRSRARL